MRNLAVLALLLAALRGEAAAQSETDLVYRERAIVYPPGQDMPTRDGRRIDEREFYQLVGQPELADRYVTRVAIGIASIVIGALSFWGGFGAFLVGGLAGNDTAFAIGLGSMVFGAMAVGVGPCLLPSPLQFDDARALAATHNRYLRWQLGLPDPPDPEEPRPKRRPARPSRWLVGPGTVFWQF